MTQEFKDSRKTNTKCECDAPCPCWIVGCVLFFPCANCVVEIFMSFSDPVNFKWWFLQQVKVDFRFSNCSTWIPKRNQQDKTKDPVDYIGNGQLLLNLIVSYPEISNCSLHFVSIFVYFMLVPVLCWSDNIHILKWRYHDVNHSSDTSLFSPVQNFKISKTKKCRVSIPRNSMKVSPRAKLV